MDLKQNREVVIGVASVFAFVLGLGGLTFQLRSDTAAKADSVIPTAREHAIIARKSPAWVARRDSNEYSVVASRKLFGSDERPAPASQRSALPQFDLPPAPIADLTMRQARVDAPPTPQSQGIVVVGRVTMDGVEQAVVEDLRRSETRFVPVPGEAFGYRVEELTSDGATLERGGRRFTIAYGESKPEQKAARPASNKVIVAAPNFPLVPGATDASTPRNWDWANMTDEQKRAGERYVRAQAQALDDL